MFTDLLDSTFAGWSFTGFNFYCIFLVCVCCLCCVRVFVVCVRACSVCVSLCFFCVRVSVCVCLCVSVVKGVRSLCFLLLLYSYDMYGLQDVWCKKDPLLTFSCIQRLLASAAIETLQLHLCLVDIIHCYSLHCSNISFIQLSSLLSGYPASSVFVVVFSWLCFCGGGAVFFVVVFLWWYGGVFVARSVGEESY